MTYREKFDIKERTENYEQFLEINLKKAIKWARAYKDLGVCYRVGRTPSEKLFTELDKGKKFLEEWEDV
jgi:hypothetical protein